jgi:hypothetical protein
MLAIVLLAKPGHGWGVFLSSFSMICTSVFAEPVPLVAHVDLGQLSVRLAHQDPEDPLGVI